MAKIVAFDFDNTLTKLNVSTEVYKLMNLQGLPSPNMVVAILEEKYGICGMFSNLMNNIYFTNYLRDKKKNKHIIFVIVTYGYKSIIDILLKKCGIRDLFSAIYTPKDFGLIECYDYCLKLNGKNKMLEKARKDFNFKFPNEKIMLVDDNSKNIEWAQRNKYSTIHVISYDGINMEYVDKLNDFINM
jgi:FMN phosphatase YigB (HAD superfamily)